MESSSSDVEAGFAKLQGEDFEYYMQTYSIILGRNSKRSTVDVDLSSLGGGMNISRHHARIFYDFQRRRFALEVLGKNGCFVEGVLHLPGTLPIKLDSQDLLRIGDKEFYFLLPVRSILSGPIGPPRQRIPNPNALSSYQSPHHIVLPRVSGVKKNGRGRVIAVFDDDFEDDDPDDSGKGGVAVAGAKKMRSVDGDGPDAYAYAAASGSEEAETM